METKMLNPFDKFDPINGDTWSLHHHHFMHFKTGTVGWYVIGWVQVAESVAGDNARLTLDVLTRDNSKFHPLTMPKSEAGFVVYEIDNHRRMRKI